MKYNNKEIVSLTHDRIRGVASDKGGVVHIGHHFLVKVFLNIIILSQLYSFVITMRCSTHHNSIYLVCPQSKAYSVLRLERDGVEGQQ